MSDPTTLGRLYGRRTGHKLRIGQAALIEDLYPQVEVPESGALTATRLFGDDRQLHFEIGFGSGEHLAGQAVAQPEQGFIGCEPFINGVVGALLHVDEQKITNIRLHMGDALQVLARLPDASLTRVYLLHPDPWPKMRHAKRRMMNPGPLAMIAAKLKRGGQFRFGTDHPIHVQWAMMQMNQRPEFAWQVRDCRDFQKRSADWPETRYERKARRLGHEVWYFEYTRV